MFYGITSKVKKYIVNQDILLGSNSSQSKYFCKEISKFSKVMLVTGKSSYELSGAKDFMNSILKDKEVIIFNNFDVNPDIDQINPGYNIAKEKKPDAIIAVGGGSVIDAAKIVHHMYCNNISEKEILLNKINNSSKFLKYIPFVAIPTTAGTGSESTHFAVLYKNKKKFSIASERMLPSMVYLDHNLCLSNTAYQNACSGFDAMAQAIESYWSKSSTILSRIYSKKAINLILDNFSNVVLEPKKNDSNMLNMLIASNYAGKAINITKTTAPHALSYGITQNLGLPHGHAVALTLGAFFNFNNLELKKNNLVINKQLKNFKNIEKIFINKIGFNPSDFLYELMINFSMEYDFNKLGLGEEMIDGIVKNINLERLQNHPISLNANQLKNTFYLVPNKN